MTASSRLVRTGLLTALSDGLFSTVLVAVFYRSSVARLWQGVASVLLGPEAFNRGAATVALGLLMHVGVAFTWSALFQLVLMRWPLVRRACASPFGVALLAVLYGPFIWTVMSWAVIPAFTHRPPTIGFRWWIQFVGHAPFVGLPIVASSAAGAGRSSSR